MEVKAVGWEYDEKPKGLPKRIRLPRIPMGALYLTTQFLWMATMCLLLVAGAYNNAWLWEVEPIPINSGQIMDFKTDKFDLSKSVSIDATSAKYFELVDAKGNVIQSIYTASDPMETLSEGIYKMKGEKLHPGRWEFRSAKPSPQIKARFTTEENTSLIPVHSGLSGGIFVGDIFETALLLAIWFGGCLFIKKRYDR